MLSLRSISLALALTALACGTSQPPDPMACAPACRVGFSCVRGACVSACNPACGAGESCIVSGASARCERGDAATPTEDGAVGAEGGLDAMVPPGDGGGEVDATMTADVPGVDAIVTPDGVAPDAPSVDVVMTDTVRPDGGGADVVSCGNAGEACCDTFCRGATSCVVPVGSSAGRCRAHTVTAGECSSSADCTGGQRCTGSFSCGDHSCYRCQPTPATGGAFGVACVNAGDCTSGVCSSGRCSTPCVPGAGGDAACGALGAGYTCAHRTGVVSVVQDGGLADTSYTSLGLCRRSCERNADCRATEVCVPSLDYPNDRLNFFCAPSRIGADAGATYLPGGAACTTSNQCDTGSCISSPGGGVCYQNCVTNADCPSTAMVCGTISWIRPFAGTQPGRACMRM